jgi:SAM-dependent methyltransferase
VYRCRGCGLAFLWPPPTAEDLEPVYASYYRENNAALHPLTQASYKKVLEWLEGQDGPGRLLDVGCGAGQFLEVASEGGWKVEGTEVSVAAVPFLEKRGLRVHRGELPEVNLEGQYDAITLFEVLEHVRHPHAYLESARSLLRPGGRLYLTTPNVDGVSRRLLGSRWRVMAVEHLSYHSPSSLRRALERAGFAGARVSSKNLDLVDLVRKLLHRSRSSANYSNIEETTRLREGVDAHRSLFLAKLVVNAVLCLAGLGDTLEGFARSPEAAA